MVTVQYFDAYLIAIIMMKRTPDVNTNTKIVSHLAVNNRLNYNKITFIKL